MSTIEKAFKAIPNQTCTRRSGAGAASEGHTGDCERCAAIRILALAVLEEATSAAADVMKYYELRKRLEKLGQ